MNEAIETIERDDFTAFIYYDTDTLNPREDWDNLGKIVSRNLHQMKTSSFRAIKTMISNA